MYKNYLVVDESQNAQFISAIVTAAGPRSAKAMVIDEYEMLLGVPYDLKVVEIEMNPEIHGVKYLVRKKI